MTYQRDHNNRGNNSNEEEIVCADHMAFQLRDPANLVDQISDAIVATDENWQITAWNRAAEKIYGWGKDETIGKNAANIFRPLYQPGERERIIAHFLKNRVWRGEVVHRTKCGDEITVFSSVTAIMKDGYLSGAVAVNRDVTQRRAYEASILHFHKMEAIGQLAAGVAHEINTPIQYVNDNVQFLGDIWDELKHTCAEIRNFVHKLSADIDKKELLQCFETLIDPELFDDLEDEVPRALDQTAEGIKRVASIVRALKEFAHPGSPEKSSANINEAIESTVVLSRNEWKYHSDVRLCLDENLPMAVCNIDEIKQALLNIIVNAAHANEDYRMKTSIEKKGQIVIQSGSVGGDIEISITDTGCGIPEAHLSRIFDPFFTTKEVGRGNGQGLAITHAIVVSKHSGRIDLASNPEGTTFRLYIPINSPQHRQEDEAVQPEL